MQLVNDPDNPTLVARDYSPADYSDVRKMVENLNQDLKDSGFDYKYKVIKKSDELHIRQI